MNYKKALDAVTLEYRALKPSDAPAYRDLRLKALNTEGYCYTANKEEEENRALLDWAAACCETNDRVTFAAFDNGQLVASTAAEVQEPGKGWWRSTFIEPEYRKSRVAERLFEMCTAWSLEHGCPEIGFTIRHDNIRSREIQEANGAQYLHEEPSRFADGSVASLRWYRKLLKDVT